MAPDRRCPAPLSRRVAARVLDVFVYGAVGAVGYAALGIEFVRQDGFGTFLLCLWMADHLWLGTFLGHSVSQWICGYVITQESGALPTVSQQVGRLCTFWVLGLASFVTSPFRRDRSALHDLVTRTRAHRVKPRGRARGARLASAGTAVALATLYGLARFEHFVYDVKILPVEEIYAGLIETIPAEAAAKPLRFENLVLLDLAKTGPASICRALGRPGLYSLEVGGNHYELHYFREERSIFGYNQPPPSVDSSATELASIPYLGPTMVALSRAPGARDAEELAARASAGERPELPLFRPLDNAQLMLQHVAWVISVPYIGERDRVETQGIRRAEPGWFAFLYGGRIPRGGWVTFNATRRGQETRIELVTLQGKFDPTVIENVVSTLALSDVPGAPVPDCGASDEVAIASRRGGESAR